MSGVTVCHEGRFHTPVLKISNLLWATYVLYENLEQGIPVHAQLEVNWKHI